ncbi:hypothetical protein GCM10009123_09500 [Kangiella japonica]|uniref:Uncharacterized protein n=1 Tax=Kangiella japonica TaxID=647384 RepID=A0ABN0SWX1_9GAMM
MAIALPNPFAQYKVHVSFRWKAINCVHVRVTAVSESVTLAELLMSLEMDYLSNSKAYSVPVGTESSYCNVE